MVFFLTKVPFFSIICPGDFVEGLYLFAKNMVDLKYPNGHKYREFFIAGIYGLLCKYNKHEKLIWTIFMLTDNYIDDKSLREIIDENNLELDLNSDDDDAISSSINAFITDQDNNLCHVLEKPIVVCSNTGNNKGNIMLLLNSWCHEMGHLIKSTYNGYTIKKPYHYMSEGKLRSGLSFSTFIFNKHNHKMFVSSDYMFTDEAINTIQTTEVMDYIISLYDIVPDSDVEEFLSELVQYENNDYGYDIITKEVRKLWEIDKFKKLIEDNIVDGNIETIINEFNSTIGDKKAFLKLDLLLDHIYNVDTNINCLMEYKENVQKIDEMVSTFKSSTIQKI